MHIPDGFLDAKTMGVGALLAAGSIGLALRHARRAVSPRRIPLMGLAAAFVFAAQMINFPVAGGTSGHLLGGVLAAVLVGPSAAVVVMTAVLIVQCFMFADGGVLSLGANLFNMAVVAPIGGYGVFRLLRRLFPDRRGLILSVAFGAWCGTVLSALSCAGQLAWAGTAAWKVVLPAMLGVHLLIGLGEGLITALIVAGIMRLRPDLLEEGNGSRTAGNYGPVIGYGLLAAGGLALFVAPFACPWPDGLERVAAHLGFEHLTAAATPGPAPLPNYLIPGMKSATLAAGWAGLIGVILAFVLAWLLARWLVPKTTE